MPKLKTHKGAQKRFNITGSGKITRMKCGNSHFRRRKSSRAKGLFDEMIPVHPTNERAIQRLLPYGVK